MNVECVSPVHPKVRTAQPALCKPVVIKKEMAIDLLLLNVVFDRDPRPICKVGEPDLRHAAFIKCEPTCGCDWVVVTALRPEVRVRCGGHAGDNPYVLCAMSAYGPDMDGGLVRMPLPFPQECVAGEAKVPIAEHELPRWEQH